MAILRLFAQAREVAGTSVAHCEGATVAEVLENAARTFGEPFAEVVQLSKVWVNGEEVHHRHPVSDKDEVAVLPPVSGGM